ncbi:MAG TPA: hypothetical protein VFI13_03265, partial [Gemmatimonadales bacterium]|nr:hypothetical protein [Gemmatimonadales bacterium]
MGGILTTPPPCRSLGPQCRRLDVTLKVADLADGVPSLDHEGTWLLGHTERIDFGKPRSEGGALLVDATLHLRCRYLKAEGGRDHCTAHGFKGKSPAPPRRPDQPRRTGSDEFVLLEGLKQVRRTVRPAAPPRRGLPVVAGTNPCLEARCTTADHTRGSACCRDLQIEILCRPTERKLEALVR